MITGDIMDKNNLESELNEEIFDIVDSAIEEEFEKYGIPKRVKYELMMAINKNMEKKFENTRIQINHIIGPVGPKQKETISMASNAHRNIVERGVIKDGLKTVDLDVTNKYGFNQPTKVDDTIKFNIGEEPIIFQPELESAQNSLNQSADRLSTHIEELKQLKSDISEPIDNSNENIRKY